MAFYHNDLVSLYFIVYFIDFAVDFWHPFTSGFYNGTFVILHFDSLFYCVIFSRFRSCNMFSFQCFQCPWSLTPC